jgi:PAS domain S-box-containing protein
MSALRLRQSWATVLKKVYPTDSQAPTGAPHVIRTGKSELIADIPDALLAEVAKNEEGLNLLHQVGYRSLMVVPLVATGRTIGAITFVSAESGRRFTASDLSLAEEVGLRTGMAIEHARLYQEVQQARDQLTIILQGVADGIIVFDQHGQIIYANEAAARVLGMPSVQALLDTPSDKIFGRYTLVDEQEQPIAISQLPHRRVLAGEQREAEALIGNREVTTGEVESWRLSRARPVYDEQGKIVFVISILHDLTGRVLEEKRKDAFLAMVSHELKTPVTSLKGFTQVLSLHLADHPEAQVRLFLERMDAQLTKLSRLINDLLTLSHMQAGDLSMREEVFDLDEQVQETMEQIQATTTTHRLQLQGAASGKVTGDRDRLAQVLVNLLTNAIRYSPQADRVLVRVRAEQRQAEIAVQDFGIGIDQAHHEQIFERFYQVPDLAERTFPGMGIGLYLARTIIERHGGRAHLGREPSGRGLHLPGAAASGQRRAE